MKTSLSLLQIVLVLMIPSVSTAFLNGFFESSPKMEVRPDLLDLTDKQNRVTIRVNLDIGEEENHRHNNDRQTHLVIQGIELKFGSDTISDEHVILPGAGGARSNLSSGHRRLTVTQQGSFITLTGTKKVELKHPTWEMVWRDNKPAGSLICGFEVPCTYRRNDGNAAFLPEGHLYISFPVWSAEGLLIGQAERNRIEDMREQFLQQRDEELELCDKTKNPFQKAIHIHKAFTAVDKSLSLPSSTHHDTIPDFSKVLKMQDDLYLTTTGLVYRTDGPQYGKKNHEFLGTAHVVTPTKSKLSIASRLLP